MVSLENSCRAANVDEVQWPNGSVLSLVQNGQLPILLCRLRWQHWQTPPELAVGQAFHVGDGVVELLALVVSDKAGRGFPEVTTVKSLLFIRICYYVILLIKKNFFKVYF